MSVSAWPAFRRKYEIVRPSTVNPRLSWVPPTRIRQTLSASKSSFFCWALIAVSELTMRIGSLSTVICGERLAMKGFSSSNELGMACAVGASDHHRKEVVVVESLQSGKTLG